jgi:ubiquinone/menaquinone biosynthesis C-methylase UbiE
MDSYKLALNIDTGNTSEYFLKSLIKNEQQKFLEQILLCLDNLKSYNIADIACGGGTLSFHLSKIFTNSQFTLVDYLDYSIDIAKKVNLGNDRMSFYVDNIYLLEKIGDSFDLTFCWQTLSWLEDPKLALEKLIGITKKGGHIYLSSLFNVNHDVDIYSKVLDLTRESGQKQIFLNYNTYSEKTIRSWIGDKVSSIEFMEFSPQIDIEYDERGLGTHTVKTGNKKRLQISGGILMNWYILKIQV